MGVVEKDRRGVTVWLSCVGIIIYITTNKSRIKVDLGDGKSHVKVEVDGAKFEYEPADSGRSSPKQSDASIEDSGAARSHSSSGAITNSIGMTMRLIPPGTFLMGASPDDPPAAAGDSRVDKPRHEVRITRPFYLSAHEVTQEKYEQIQGVNPIAFRSETNLPVDSVSVVRLRHILQSA